LKYNKKEIAPINIDASTKSIIILLIISETFFDSIITLLIKIEEFLSKKKGYGFFKYEFNKLDDNSR
jgi:hypothetical protein